MKIPKINKTAVEVLKPFNLEPDDQVFLILYLAGFTQVQSYIIAYDSHARSIAPMACHNLTRLEKPARKLAEYMQIHNLEVPPRFRKWDDQEQF